MCDGDSSLSFRDRLFAKGVFASPYEQQTLYASDSPVPMVPLARGRGSWRVLDKRAGSKQFGSIGFFGQLNWSSVFTGLPVELGCQLNWVPVGLGLIGDKRSCDHLNSIGVETN